MRRSVQSILEPNSETELYYIVTFPQVQYFLVIHFNIILTLKAIFPGRSLSLPVSIQINIGFLQVRATPLIALCINSKWVEHIYPWHETRNSVSGKDFYCNRMGYVTVQSCKWLQVFRSIMLCPSSGLKRGNAPLKRC
jgi:hypothetical protein